MRSLAFLALLALILSMASFHTANALVGPCCVYAFIVSDTQPKQGERVDFIGAVTDQTGAGDANVVVQYQDSYGNSSMATTDPTGAFFLSHTVPSTGYSRPVVFNITMTDNTWPWNQTVEDMFPRTSNLTSGASPALYYSQVAGRAMAYINIHSVGGPGVLYFGGGSEQPILHGDSPLDLDNKRLLDTLAGDGFNVLAPIGWSVPDLPTFPYVLGAMLKYGFQMSHLYLLGCSAGGSLAAWTLTRDLNHIFTLGVIMDADINGPMNQTLTNPQVFNTLQSAASISAPHILIWGSSDSGIQSAMMWAKKNPIARLDHFTYAHQWIGSNIEPEVVTDIVTFFNSGTSGIRNSQQLDGYTFQALTNSQLNQTTLTYDSRRQAYSFEVTGQDGTIGSLNLVIPISSINGQPVVLVDGIVVSSLYMSDTSDYYIYLTYEQSSHQILVAGQNTVPEFPGAQYVLQITLMACILIIASSLRKKTRSTREDHVKVV